MASEMLQDLKRHSIRIYNGMEVTWPEINQISRLNTEKIKVALLNGCYNIQNFMVAFCCEGMLYVTAYTPMVTEILRKSKFVEKYFEVPFSHGEYPTKEQEKLEIIKKEAKECRKKEFAESCRKCSARSNVKSLDDVWLNRCLEIPENGVKVDMIGYIACFYPEVSGCSTIDNIGKYNYNNGVTIFVYYDGRTFVTKGSEICSILKSRGYTQNDKMKVPFSNGETILDEEALKKWQAI